MRYLLIAVLLSGCAYPEMRGDGGSAPYARDMEYCRAVAESYQRAQGGGLIGITQQHQAKSAAYKVCMMDRGYAAH